MLSSCWRGFSSVKAIEVVKHSFPDIDDRGRFEVLVRVRPEGLEYLAIRALQGHNRNLMSEEIDLRAMHQAFHFLCDEWEPSLTTSEARAMASFQEGDARRKCGQGSLVAATQCWPVCHRPPTHDPGRVLLQTPDWLSSGFLIYAIGKCLWINRSYELTRARVGKAAKDYALQNETGPVFSTDLADRPPEAGASGITECISDLSGLYPIDSETLGWVEFLGTATIYPVLHISGRRMSPALMIAPSALSRTVPWMGRGRNGLLMLRCGSPERTLLSLLREASNAVIILFASTCASLSTLATLRWSTASCFARNAAASSSIPAMSLNSLSLLICRRKPCKEGALLASCISFRMKA